MVYILKLHEHYYGDILFYINCELSYELVTADFLQVVCVLVVLY